MTTPAQIIQQALKASGIIGVGQTASSEDSNDAFTLLNWMIAQWAQKRWMIYHLVDVAKVSTGAVSYTVGPGGDFNVALRPDRLEAAFYRQVNIAPPNQPDTPLTILEAREDYNAVTLKSFVSVPSSIFYDPAYPMGVVYPVPAPLASIYELHLTLKMVLSQFTGLSQEISLPPAYMAALHYNLVSRLRSAYQMPPDPAVEGFAKDAVDTIRGSNTQISILRMPQDLIRSGVYNIYADNMR